MTELALQDYWKGNLSLEDLSTELANCRVDEAVQGTRILVEMVDVPVNEHHVSRQELRELCDAVLKRKLQAIDLNTIAYILILSEHYTWDGSTEDGEIISTTLFDWDSPEINFPLSNANIKRWKTYLITGRNELAIKDKNE